MKTGTVVKIKEKCNLRVNDYDWNVEALGVPVKPGDIAVILDSRAGLSHNVYASQSKVFVSRSGQIGWIVDILLKELTQ